MHCRKVQPTSVLGLDYGYGTTNNNGNVLSQTITAPGFSTSQSYTYDALNRLGQAMEAGSWTQTYGHDQYGNHWVMPGSYMPDPTLTPQAQTDFNPNNNRLAASGYDATGNQTLDAAGRTFGYDLESRQTSFNGTAALRIQALCSQAAGDTSQDGNCRLPGCGRQLGGVSKCLTPRATMARAAG